MVSGQVCRLLFVVCGLLIASLTLTVCGDEPPDPEESSDRQSAPHALEAQRSQAATAQSETRVDTSVSQAADSAPRSTPAVAELEIEVDGNTLWRDVYDTLSDSELSCLREELGDERLQVVLKLPIIFEGDAETWMATAYGCLLPERARTLSASALIAGIAQEEGVELSGSEQACVRESVSDINPADAIAAMTVDAEDPSAAAELLSSLLRCIPDLLLNVMVAEMGISMEDLGEAEASCLQEWAVGIDWAALFGDARGDNPAAFLTLAAGLFSCVPQVLVSEVFGSDLQLSEDESACMRASFADLDEAMLSEALGAGSETSGLAAFASVIFACVPELVLSDVMGVDVALGAEESACLRDSFNAAGMGAIHSAEDAPETQARLAATILNCVPHLFVASLTGDRELSADAESCLLDLMSNTDAAALIGEGEDSEAFTSFTFGLIACAPDLLQPEPAVEEVWQSEAELDLGAAQPVAIGEAVEGALEVGAVSGVFVFEADAEQLYQIDVTLGTLEDSVLTLYDADEWQVAYNDDHAGSLASRVFWRAPGGGRYYAEVAGYGPGSYTLIVIESDITDDHGDSTAKAAAAPVGERLSGALEYGGDIDVFEFAAEAGQLYEIDVALDTLHDSVLRLLDAEGFQLSYNDDSSGSTASRIYWDAPASGRFYVEVSGFALGVGSYTVAVTASDIDDDHGGSPMEATPILVGELNRGAVDYEGDLDQFVFDSQAGQIYVIDVDGQTLLVSSVALYDAAEWQLASDNYYGDSPESQIVWRAPASESYYVGLTRPYCELFSGRSRCRRQPRTSLAPYPCWVRVPLPWRTRRAGPPRSCDSGALAHGTKPASRQSRLVWQAKGQPIS